MSQPTSPEPGENSLERRGDTAPAPRDWDDVFARAEDQQEDQPALPPRPANSRTVTLLKVLTPLIVLTAYLVIRYVDSVNPGRLAVPWTLPVAPSSLTDVAEPADPPTPGPDARTRSLLARLESLYAANDWQALRGAAANASNRHPLVASFELIARARLGETSLDLERALVANRRRVEALDDPPRALVEELRLCEAEQILARVHEEELLFRNIEKLLDLIGSTSLTPRAVEVRRKFALDFEHAGDALLDRAIGLFSDSPDLLRRAREAYQTGLRVLVTPDGFLTLEEISPRVRPDILRLEDKIRAANRRLHGPVMPFTGRDRNTWTGIEGDPIHDAPPGGARP